MPNERVSLKGKGADLFLGDFAPGSEPSPPPPEEGVSRFARDGSPAADRAGAPQPVTHASATDPSRHLPRQSAVVGPDPSTPAPANLTDPGDAIEAIRQIVKRSGREVSFIRLTPGEKAQLTEIVYRYKRRGQKTTENEINRIALNSLLRDYREKGEQSMLAQVLAALVA